MAGHIVPSGKVCPLFGAGQRSILQLEGSVGWCEKSHFSFFRRRRYLLLEFTHGEVGDA